MENKKIDNDEMNGMKYGFMINELNQQQQNFFDRMRNCDTKLGIIIALISGIILYAISNLSIREIVSLEWINNHNLILFILLLLIDISIIVLLYTSIIFALIGIKTKKSQRIRS